MSDRAPGESASGRLSTFVSEAQWDAVPASVRHEAKRSLLNFFACALGGSSDAFIESASAALRPFMGAANATVIGRAFRADAPGAAFLNAASANVFDFDDTHTRTVIHPTAPVAAALFALAERTPMSGRELLLALILGIETECRIGNAISPGHYRRGWHITSTCGVFGAAAAVAKALGFSPERTRWSLGNASAQASGLLETLGTMAKSISVGNAARNGLMGALFAQQNVAGPDRPLEGPYGFLRVTAEAPDPDSLIEGLGEHWEIALNTYKPYPCGIVLSPVIEACLALSNDARCASDEVERVEITAHPLLRERTDRVRPQSGREAQVSAQHAVAVALQSRKAGLREFTDERARDPALDALRGKVVFVDDAACALESAMVSLYLRGGAQLTRRIDCARGSSARPLSDRDLEQKLEDLNVYGGSNCDARPLIDALWTLDRAENAAPLIRLAAGAR